MLYLCSVGKDKEKEEFVIFDKDKFEPEKYNLEPIKEITQEELKTGYCLYPIIKLSDFLFGMLNTKKRTATNRMSECKIETFKAFDYEANLIAEKKSKLSHSQRELVLKIYNEILSA